MTLLVKILNVALLIAVSARVGGSSGVAPAESKNKLVLAVSSQILWWDIHGLRRAARAEWELSRCVEVACTSAVGTKDHLA